MDGRNSGAIEDELNNTEGVSRHPNTISSAKKVGQMMSEMSENQTPNPPYRFYM